VSIGYLMGFIPYEIKEPEIDSKIREQLENVTKQDFLIFEMKDGQLRFEDEVNPSRFGDIAKIYVCRTRAAS